MPLTEAVGCSLNHIVHLDRGLCRTGLFESQCPIPNGVLFGRTRQVGSQRRMATELSIISAFNAMPFVCSVPILVASQDQIGTGYGLYKAVSGV
jgi:hypothetical protein